MTTSERIRSLRSVVVPESGCLPRVCLQREEFFSKSAGRPSTAATTVSVRIAAQLQPSGYIRYKRPVSTCWQTGTRRRPKHRSVPAFDALDFLPRRGLDTCLFGARVRDRLPLRFERESTLRSGLCRSPERE